MTPLEQDKQYNKGFNDFSSGMVNDPRSERLNTARVISNFDILTDPKRLIPYRNSESGDSSASTSKKQNFCIALRTGTTYSLYSLGVVSGGALAEVLYKDLTTGSSNDLDDATWATPTANQSSAGTTAIALFVYYKKTGFIYGARGGSQIWRFDPAGGAWVDSHQALSYGNIAQGLVHSADDILYIPYDNVIARNSNGSWNTTALTLPSHLYITSIWEDGTDLMIACAPLSGVGDSVVFRWNRDVSLTTVTEGINLGAENVKVADKTDDFNVTISLSSGTTRFTDKVIFRYLLNGKSVKFAELIGNSSTQLPIAKQVINNRLYFMASIVLNGTRREGVFSVGRDYINGGFSIVHERTPNNDTALTSGVLNDFFFVGDFLFQSYVDNSAYAVSKTNDQESYISQTAILESKIINDGDSSATKKLDTVTVMFEPLPTNGQVVLKYKKDEETSYTTLYTYTTDNAISHGTGGQESSSGALPQYKEIQFRIESKGGAVITGFKKRSTVINNGEST